MEWLTLTEIGRRARSEKGALEVSYEHWNQLYEAKADELRAAIKNEKVALDCDHCGLCRHYGWHGCDRCPLEIADYPCRHPNSIYRKASIQFFFWESGNKNWWVWKRAAKALRDKLKELLDAS